MKTRIIAVANQKGGVGKTTLTMTLAGTLGEWGQRVLVIDADAQGTATRWAADSAPDLLTMRVVSMGDAGERLHEQIRPHIPGHDWIVIDCPPSVESRAAQSALLIADLVVIPVIPSPADLWATQYMRRLVQEASKVNPDLQAVLVANMLPHTTLGREALAAMADLDLPVATSTIGLRTAYREAAIEGVPVQRLGSRARDAITEIEALTNEIVKILGGGHGQRKT